MRLPRFISFLLTVSSLLVASWPAHGADPNLPDIGSPASAVLSLEDEARLGSMVVRGLRDQGQLLNDPEINEYVQSLGLQLSSQSPQQGGRNFQFFVVRDSSINAFALPGGFIGVNAGLLLASHDESELAGVLAHEISHVTQRHIARGIAAENRNGIVSTAAMLAAILVGAAAGGGDMAMAGIAAAQSMALQNQMSFSRAEETEADNVGITLMARAGFDPNGMWRFFEVIERQNGSTKEADIPAIVRNHPVTSERIAETRARAASLHVTAPNKQSLSYALMRERMRVLSTPAGEDPRQYYSMNVKDEAKLSDAALYGKALANINAGSAKEAVRILKTLQGHDATVMPYHTALAQAQLAADDTEGALATFAKARLLFPRNIPITVRYGEALLRSGDAKQAHEVLLDLFNIVPPTPDQAKLIALAANAAGDISDAYSYMAEYYIMGGDLALATSQLQMALSVPNITTVQRAKFEARLEEVQRAIPRKIRNQMSQDGGSSRLQ